MGIGCTYVASKSFFRSTTSQTQIYFYSIPWIWLQVELYKLYWYSRSSLVKGKFHSNYILLVRSSRHLYPLHLLLHFRSVFYPMGTNRVCVCCVVFLWLLKFHISKNNKNKKENKSHREHWMILYGFYYYQANRNSTKLPKILNSQSQQLNSYNSLVISNFLILCNAF